MTGNEWTDFNILHNNCDSCCETLVYFLHVISNWRNTKQIFFVIVIVKIYRRLYLLQNKTTWQNRSPGGPTEVLHRSTSQEQTPNTTISYQCKSLFQILTKILSPTPTQLKHSRFSHSFKVLKCFLCSPVALFHVNPFFFVEARVPLKSLQLPQARMNHS